MEGEGPAGLEADGGLSPAELVERELAVLRAVDGVVSARAYERQRRQPLNSSMVKVRLSGTEDPIVVHCSAGVPTLAIAVQRMAAKVAAALGSDAVAEGRRRCESAREAEAAAAGGAATGPGSSAQQANAFAHMQRVFQLEKDLCRANARVRDADGGLRSALLRVKEEQLAVKLARERLSEAEAAAKISTQALSLEKAAAMEIRSALEALRSKRQRIDEPAAADAEQVEPQAAPHFSKFKDYTFLTYRREEVKEAWRRAVIPSRLGDGVELLSQPRLGVGGALHHWRRGLVGAFQSWAAGCLEHVIFLVVKIIDYFCIWVDIAEHLPSRLGVLPPPALPDCLRPRCRRLIQLSSCVCVLYSRK